MADVLIICVREDVVLAEALAEVFDAAGFSVDEQPTSEAALRAVGAGVVLWSKASRKSHAFKDAAERVIDSGKAVIANLTKSSPIEIGAAPDFDLSGWDGDLDDPDLHKLFTAVERMVDARESVGASVALEDVRSQPLAPPRQPLEAQEKSPPSPFWAARAPAPPAPRPTQKRVEPHETFAPLSDPPPRREKKVRSRKSERAPPSMRPKSRGFFYGMSGVFSLLVLAALLSGGLATTAYFRGAANQIIAPALDQAAPIVTSAAITPVVDALNLAEVAPLETAPIPTLRLASAAPAPTPTTARPAVRRARAQATPPPTTSWDRTQPPQRAPVRGPPP